MTTRRNPILFNNHTSYIFADGNFLYIGEFNNSKNYACTNEISWNGITHMAIVEKFNPDDFSKPLAVYSVPDEIQGFAITPQKSIVLSRSYGLSDSLFFVYTNENITVETLE